MTQGKGAQRPVVLVVTGSGRSGTSSLAGSLKRLGLHVPQPEVEPKPTNPRGFYEPRWVIDFHKRHLHELSLHNIDSRPDAAAAIAARRAEGDIDEELREWLSGQLEHPQVLVKDPHAYWFAETWRSSCDQLGADLRFLTSLRHPTEVVGSRELAYLQEQPEEFRRTKEISNVVGWINAALLTERAGRPHRRGFMLYTDLMTDWRSTLGTVRDQLDLTYDPEPVPGEHHPIDDFVDSDMRKSRLTWADVRVPEPLQVLAEETWRAMTALVTDPSDEAAMSRLDQLRFDYDAMYADAKAMVYDDTRAQRVLAERALKAEAREQRRAQNRRSRRQRARIVSLSKRVRELEAARTGSDDGGAGVSQAGVRGLAASALRRTRRLVSRG